MRASGLSAASFELDPSVAVGPLALGPDPRHNQPLALLDALLEVSGCMEAKAAWSGNAGKGLACCLKSILLAHHYECSSSP